MLDMVRKDSFRNGVHPPEHKDETSHLSIRRFPFAPVLVVPLSQHLGKPSISVVREGEEVVRGQTIAKPDGIRIRGNACTGFRCSPKNCARAKHQWRHGTERLSATASGLVTGSRRWRTLRRRNRDARRNHHGNPASRRSRSRRRGVSNPCETQTTRGKTTGYPHHQWRRVRALPDHGPPGHARADRGHIHRHQIPAACDRSQRGDHRGGGQQAGRGDKAAAKLPGGFAGQRTCVSGQIPAGRREAGHKSLTGSRDTVRADCPPTCMQSASMWQLPPRLDACCRGVEVFRNA